MRFIKLHGCGNSFVIVWDPQQSLDLCAWTKQVSSSSFGIGSDGVMVVRPSVDRNRSHFDVQMINPDGSDMGMCGNGIRCVVRFLVLEGRLPSAQSEVNFTVGKRLIRTTFRDSGKWVRVDMGAPSDIEDNEIVIDQRTFQFVGLSMGNPHCVISVPDLNVIALRDIGPRIEHHPLFPNRTNTEFVQRLAADRIRVIVWERGAGATLACGTGACASAVAMIRSRECSSPVTVVMPGGELLVEWDGGDNSVKQSPSVFLSGPTQEICTGELSLQ